METQTVPDHPIKLPSAIAAPFERSWTEDDAFRYCTQLTKSHYENFPVGSLLAPAGVQPAIHSLYAFMRTADDFADEHRSESDEAERMAYLESWERLLLDAQNGKPTHPIFIALRRTMERYGLPVEWLQDLLRAFKLDVTKYRYANEAELLDYCCYSANPVGRLILTLFGYRSEELYALSDSICTGLQLANHWQDVSVDLDKNRIYLPQDHMNEFGLADHDLFDLKKKVQVSPGTAWDMRSFQQLLASEVDKAEQFFLKGQSLPNRVSGRLRVELRMTWLGGYTILQKIKRADYDVFRKRPVVSKLDWLMLGAQALVNSGSRKAV